MTRARGFTLIEILLVIVIMVILVAMAVPNFARGYGTLQLRQAADDIKNRVRWAQAMAMGQQRLYRLDFVDNGMCYTVMRAKENETGRDTAYERVPGAAGKKVCPPDGVSLKASEHPVVFYPDGTLDPVEISLRSGGHIVVLSSQAKRGAMVVINEE